MNNLSHNEHLKRKLAIFGTVRAIKNIKAIFLLAANESGKDK